ncbi:SDR family oxidoreductase [Streptomyces hesseae]|uniref:SDR family oxidoreductase n=1 Tax=Streptomyces hesseae TaxID=3075519 RepID=A0ABU2SJ01_9ACTN|nr:SDR family oxidoreductase [Streptomyces sp. DSM 40473]MDT0448055.1 SDR family oxidoreductase [Streptomyces sp. DSM 40473]
MAVHSGGTGSTARGVVVSSSGALGLRSWPDNGLYGAAKTALDFLTRTWAVEPAPRGIRVVGVAPGLVDTGSGGAHGPDGGAAHRIPPGDRRQGAVRPRRQA